MTKKMTPGGLLKRAQSSKPTPVQGTRVSSKNFITKDSFSNVVAKLGLQEDNQISNSYYNLGPFISRNRLELEAMYRSSWVVGQVVDTVSEDMTREGVTFNSAMSPDDLKQMQVAIEEFAIWDTLCSTIKWARLYGGCIAVLLIDGADYSKPLDIKKIRKDQFKGLVVLDRWMIQPDMGDLIDEVCKDMGKPKFYEVLPGNSMFPGQRIHYSRVLRFDGIELPYYQKLFENLWGLSVVERMLDRLIAFDSATQGAAQLVYKAYLRTIKLNGLRNALANGGEEEQAVVKNVRLIRQLQTIEGITVIDGEDDFQGHNYTFAGLDDILMQFGMQISGCTGIPLVRLFGQSPAGLNSTGESDLRNYYDRIKKDQEIQMRSQLHKLFAVMCKSRLNKDLPEDFQFTFRPLWQLSDTEKATIAQTDSQTQSNAINSGIITRPMALKELKQQSDITNRFTNITEEDIEDAENEPPPGQFEGLEELLGGGGPPSEESEASENANERMGGQNPELLNESTEAKGEIPKVEDSIKPLRIKVRDALINLIKHIDPDFVIEKEETPNNTIITLDQETVDRARRRKKLKRKIKRSKKVKEFVSEFKQEKPEIIEEQKSITNSNGIVYKGYTISQESDGQYVVYSIGGSIVGRFPELPLAMNKVNQVATGA